jgi:hypothetical protein
MTLRAVPLKPIVTAARNAARALAARLRESDLLQLYLEPELDIVTYFPAAETPAEVDRRSAEMLSAGMADPQDPVFLSTLKVAGETLPGGARGADAVRILRSVLMKPEHEAAVPWLANRLEELARATRAAARTPAGD